MEWRNRIVSYVQVNPSELAANTMNFRRHPHIQRMALRAAIDEVGYVIPVIVNKNTMNIVDGHLRVELAIEQKITSIPVIFLDVDQEEENKLLATIDPITQLATIDKLTLDELLGTIHSQSEIINQMWDNMKNDNSPSIVNQTFNNTGSETNPFDIYTGMPDYQHEDKGAYQSVVVHLANEQAVLDFAKLIGQNITPKTKFVWHPALVREDFTGIAYDDDDTDNA